MLLLSNIKTWTCGLSLPSPVEIARLSSATFPPPPWLLGVAVSHSQLSVQPCGFWLLVTQMISYMVADAHNRHEVKMLRCRVRLMTDEGDDCQDISSLTLMCLHYPLSCFYFTPDPSGSHTVYNCRLLDSYSVTQIVEIIIALQGIRFFITST